MNSSGMISRALLILVLLLTLMTGCAGQINETTPTRTTSPVIETPIPEGSRPTVTLDTEYFGLSDNDLAKLKGPGTPNTAVVGGRTITVSRIYSQMQLDMECETTFMLSPDDIVIRILHTFQQPYGNVLMKLQEGLGSQGQLERDPERDTEKVTWEINGFHYTLTSSTSTTATVTIDKSLAE